MMDSAGQVQQLAEAALRDPTGPGRDMLIAAVQPRLPGLAKRQLQHKPALDLVQEFLAEKVLAAGRLTSMFSKVVSGERRLWPRLLRLRRIRKGRGVSNMRRCAGVLAHRWLVEEPTGVAEEPEKEEG